MIYSGAEAYKLKEPSFASVYLVHFLPKWYA